MFNLLRVVKFVRNDKKINWEDDTMNLKSTLMGLALATFATTASAEMVLRYTDGGPNRGARAAAQTYSAEQVEEL